MNKPFDPNWRVHPGETVNEIIEDFHLSQRVAAKALGVTEQYLSDIIEGRRGISPRIATRLAGVFGPSAGFWMRMQANCDAPLPSERQSLRRKFGDQRACVKCGQDIEWHGRKAGWLDRGSGVDCLLWLANPGKHKPASERF